MNIGVRELLMKLSKEVENGITRRRFVKNTAIKGAAAFAIGAGGLAMPATAESQKSSPKISGKSVRLNCCNKSF